MASDNSQLTHLSSSGETAMVDVSAKPTQMREAVAQGSIHLAPATLAAITEATVKKGDVLAVARVAGIQGAKQCSQLIPLCHPLPLSKIGVDFALEETSGVITITCTTRTVAQTGVEMEALTGVAVAALTIYDMCKGIDKDIRIGETQLLDKTKTDLPA